LPAVVWHAIESGEHPIRAIREFCCLTQIDLAGRAGLRQHDIGDIEARRETGSTASLKAIATALGVPLNILAG
jgi:transcriptional regulator with XRE-family HTH domain